MTNNDLERFHRECERNALERDSLLGNLMIACMIALACFIATRGIGSLSITLAEWGSI